MNAFLLGIGDAKSGVPNAAPFTSAATTVDANLAALFASVLASAAASPTHADAEPDDLPVGAPVTSFVAPDPPASSFVPVPAANLQLPLPMVTPGVDDLEADPVEWLAQKSDPAASTPALQSGRATVVPLRTIAVQVERSSFEQFSRGVLPRDLVIPIDLDIPEHSTLTGEFKTPAGAVESGSTVPFRWSTPPSVKGQHEAGAKVDSRSLAPGPQSPKREAGRGPVAQARVSAALTNPERADVAMTTRTFMRVLALSPSHSPLAPSGAGVAVQATSVLPESGMVPLRRSVAPLDFGRARGESVRQESHDADGTAPRGIVREVQVISAPVAALATLPIDPSGAGTPADVAALKTVGSEVTFTVQNWQPGRTVQQMRIALEPAELGNIQIHFRQRGDKLFARIIASRPEAMPFIRANLDSLRATLAQRGIQFGGFSLTAASALTAVGLPPEGLGLGHGSGRKTFGASTAHDERDLQEESIAA